MRNRSRRKKTTYVLQVTCDKVPSMNEAEFLTFIRDTLQDKLGQHTGERPRVSVLRKIEEYITQAP